MREQALTRQALVLTEGLAGLQNQALGLGERAGLICSQRTLHPAGLWSALPARFWPNPPRMVELDREILPHVLIGCGGKAAAVIAALRPRGHLAIHIQHPRLDPRRFDLVVVQPHDQLTGDNVVVTRTAMHRVSPSVLVQARIDWQPHFAALPRPLVSVLVGGNNGRLTLGAREGALLANSLAEMMRSHHVGVALTASRRTAPEVLATLRQTLQPLGAWVWTGKGDNPYLGLLACADAIIVTSDSVSMISEAAATSAPIMVFPLPGRSRRIAAFIRSLVAARRIRLYGGHYESWACAPLDDTDMATARLRLLLPH